MHKKAIFWNFISAFKWIANTSAHSTFKEKCKTEFALNLHFVDSVM